MKRFSFNQYILAAFVLMSVSTFGQSKNTANTLALDAKENQQKATIEDMAWLTGSWLGKGFGGTCEEVWSTPRADGMMGMFQMIGDKGVVFYELCQIVEENGSLVLKLKHFNGDLTAWETKEETVDFPLVKMEGTTAWFSGLTYIRTGDTLHAYVAFENDGKVDEGHVTFKLSD